ncbi:MAG: hypothetical protein CW335_02515 [Clostridiales bacterium]|nr:hypothetical protein [Clostridiales bacterium]
MIDCAFFSVVLGQIVDFEHRAFLLAVLYPYRTPLCGVCQFILIVVAHFAAIVLFFASSNERTLFLRPKINYLR